MPYPVKKKNSGEHVLEVCIALSAMPQDASSIHKMSHEISQYIATELKATALVQLGMSDVRLSVAPHLTLYQCSLPLRKIEKACRELNVIASQQPLPLKMYPKGINLNYSEGSIEVAYNSNLQISSLQGCIVGALNPLRGELLVDRDPAGHVVHDTWLREYRSGVVGNVMATGWAEGTAQVGGV